MALSKKHKTLIIAFLIPLLVSGISFWLEQQGYFHPLEAKSLDARFKYSQQNTKANPEVVVLLIDEASLQSMEPLVGRWPWPRSLYGELLDFLTQAGAKGVLFDILFTEPQVPRNEAGELGESDSAMVMSSASSGFTHHAFQIFNDVEDEVNKGLINQPMPNDFVSSFALKNIQVNTKLPKNNHFYLPLKEIYQNTSSMGVVEFSSDKDGVYRSTHLARHYQGGYFPVLSMSYLLNAFRPKKIEVNSDNFKFNDLKVPLLWNGKYLINMKKEFTNYSMGGVFATIQKINQGETEGLIVNPEDFKDKIIVLGASAVGVDDLKMTSTGMNIPGVYLHASILSNFLDQDFIHQISVPLTFLIFLMINFLLAWFVITGLHLTWPLVIFFAVLLGHTGLSFYLFDNHRLWILIISPLTALALNFLVLFIVKSFTEGKEKKFLKAAFGNYISPELIDMMYQKGETPKLGGDVGRRSAFFTDIQGFSSFSEKLSAPKLVELLNEYLSVMTDILIEEQGTLDKYEGDAIIAFFGAPMPLADHAKRAVRTALRMQAALARLREKWTAEGDKWPKIVHDMRMRIGINTGEIVTGNMGSKLRMNYTMMGDAVNLAARLEESAKQYGIFTHISHFTYQEIKDDFICRELDTIRVVGKSESITTYEPLMLVEEQNELLLKLKDTFHAGLKAYKEQQWEEAQKYFELSAGLEEQCYPGLLRKTNPSKIYLERCVEFKQTPPPANWDGVFNLTHK